MTLPHTLLAAAFILAAGLSPSLAPAFADEAPSPETLKLGEELLTRDCSNCHAVGVTGASPHADAPPFRSLGLRYPLESLEEALGEGIMSGHPDMPEFDYEADEVGAIIDYMKSIQRR
jgi:mono/diheme cytochrome c family protein